MCRKERNSCCKPNPYSLIFHHLGTSSVVFSITASAFCSAVVSESKFPKKLPFRLARSTCTEPGHRGSTHITTQQRRGHEAGSISTSPRLAEPAHWRLPVSSGTEGIPGAVLPPGSTRNNSAPLHQTDGLRSALTQVLGKYPEPRSAQVTPRNLQIQQRRTISSSCCNGLILACFSSHPPVGRVPKPTDVHRR